MVELEIVIGILTCDMGWGGARHHAGGVPSYNKHVHNLPSIYRLVGIPDSMIFISSWLKESCDFVTVIVI